MPLKELGFRLLSVLYELIFKEKMDDQARSFVLSTLYVGIGTLVGSLFTLAFSIIAARALGPGNFGVLGLITTVGTILAISMIAASTPMIKYGSEVQDHFVQVSIISTLYILIALLTAASIGIYVLFSAPLSYLFGVPAEVFFFALFLAVTSTLYQLTTNSLRVFFKMRAYALLTAAQSSPATCGFSHIHQHQHEVVGIGSVLVLPILRGNRLYFGLLPQRLHKASI